MDPDSSQRLSLAVSKTLVQCYAYLTLVVAFLSALATVALIRLPRQNSRFFVIVFLLFWTVFLFITAVSLLGETVGARWRILVVCCTYALMPALLYVPWFERYFLFLYQWLQLTCWAWPSLTSGTCSFTAPEFMSMYGISLAFIVAVLGIVIFTVVKPVRELFRQQNRLETLLGKPE
jgi:hypothetical protein